MDQFDVDYVDQPLTELSDEQVMVRCVAIGLLVDPNLSSRKYDREAYSRELADWQVRGTDLNAELKAWFASHRLHPALKIVDGCWKAYTALPIMEQGDDGLGLPWIECTADSALAALSGLAYKLRIDGYFPRGR